MLPRLLDDPRAGGSNITNVSFRWKKTVNKYIKSKDIKRPQTFPVVNGLVLLNVILRKQLPSWPPPKLAVIFGGLSLHLLKLAALCRDVWLH